MMLRAFRYGDNGELIRDPAAQTYFAGRFSDMRMDVVRRSIEEVRGSWRNYDRVPDEVYAFIERLAPLPDGMALAQLIEPVERSFRQNRDWADRFSGTHAPAEFPLIHLYTTMPGYETLFGALNRRYRSDAETPDYRTFVPVTWLVELLNMELFALTLADPGAAGARTVCRGTVFPLALLDRYRLFADQDLPLEKRCISIPLGLHSTSSVGDVARRFIAERAKDQPAGTAFAVIWNIHVVSLSQERLALYHGFYPHSVVSSICATDISAVSEFGEDEQEVLLRGPFFEAISFEQVECIAGLPTFVLNAVMLDSNRDHISTFELDRHDAAARTLFRKLVSAQKFEACAAVAQDLGKPALAALYAEAAGIAETEVERAVLDLES